MPSFALLSLHERIGSTGRMAVSDLHGEMLFAGLQGAVLTDLRGRELAGWGELPDPEASETRHEILGLQRTTAGWQSLHVQPDRAWIRCYEDDAFRDVVLPVEAERILGTAWDGSGQRIAIGLRDSTLAVFATDSGRELWSDHLPIEADDLFRQDEHQQVHGWVAEGKLLISTMELLLSRHTVIWDGRSGQRLAVIEF